MGKIILIIYEFEFLFKYLPQYGKHDGFKVFLEFDNVESIDNTHDKTDE